ncbi:UDP-xylose and UDP-N-acetylglucosamine transporter-like [Cloeon dipterum]|uniref:UDP-xylose and UDP-N-acetylglucosamine transporter-like n=1 Tax=Cloeon dipterum TaxID=197152 RepID=UPI00322024B2
MKPVTAGALVFFGCCFNIYFLELLVKQDPGAGVLATFSQYIFITLHGIIFTVRCGTVTPQIPVSHYAAIVILVFASNVCNNYAFNFNISMPLHVIIRSGSLIANMILGMVILQRHYSGVKVASVLAITLGVVVCTLESGKAVKTEDATADEKNVDFLRWLFGVSILLAGLFLSARLGIYQEVLFNTHGKHNEEALFYTHLLPLPGFLIVFPHLWTHWLLALESPPLVVSWLSVPSALIYLLGYMLTQFVCISSVFVLTTECSSLTVTLVLTIRRFLSLVFSILYFNNSFTQLHWIGAFFVFAGTLGFSLT